MPGLSASELIKIKDLYAFRSLTDQELHKVGAVSDLVEMGQDETLDVFEGDQAPFYMVLSGHLTLKQLRGSDSAAEDSLPYRAGLFFGADALLYGKVRRLRATAVSPTSLLYIPQTSLRNLIQTIPHFKEGLLFASQMQQWLRDKAFNSWIGNEELVYLISRKHPLFLVLRLIFPVLVMVFGLLLIAFGFTVETSSVQMASVWIGLLFLGAAVLWAIWRYIDWGNDYYVVTDQRVVWIEQVLFMYDSRREAFLSSIRNKRVSTSNWLERQFGYGDIIMTIFAGQLTFKNIPDPIGVDRMIDILVRRAQLKEKKIDVQETQNLILRKIDEVEKIMREEVDPIPPPPPPVKIIGPRLPTWQEIVAFFKADTRFEQGEMITYRTHILFLFVKTFLPGVLQLAVLLLMGWGIWRTLNGQDTIFSLPTILLLGICVSAVFFAIMLYHYMDWRNDMYQILPDKLIDRDHKPFQEENITQALLDSVLSLEVERENFLEMLFNYGTVVINSGSDQRLTFDNIPDPARALQDIYTYLNQFQQAQHKNEMLRQAEQSAVVLATYHLYEQSQRLQSDRTAPAPETE
jgi:hypothetical protein